MQKFEQKEALIWLAFWCFVLLYPLFFWYHALLFYGAIPELLRTTLRGWYGPACLLSICIFALNSRYLLQYTKIRTDWIFVIFFCYVLWSLIWSSAQMAFFPTEYTVEGARKLYLSLTLQVSNFLIGSLLVVSKKTVRTPVLWLAWSSMTFFCFAVYQPNYGSVFHSLSLDTELAVMRDNDANISSYQGLARSFLMTSLLLISLTELNALRFLVQLFSLLALILIGAKSELLGFVCAITLFEFANIRASRITFGNLLIGLAGTTVTLTCVVVWLWEHLGRVRTFSFFNLLSDQSTNTRLSQINDAIAIILDKPIVGDFAVHLKFGNHGDMAHSILSAWTMLGLPGFLLILSMIVGSCYAALRARVIAKNEDATWNHALLLAAMACPQLLISKSAFVEWLPLLFGSIVAARTLAPELGQACISKD